MGGGGPSPGGAVAEKIKDCLKRYYRASMLRTLQNVSHMEHVNRLLLGGAQIRPDPPSLPSPRRILCSKGMK